MPKRTDYELGHEGERRAELFLKEQGYRILKKNYQVRLGEIDLIARDGKVTCFLEIKTRRGETHDHGLSAVSSGKQRKMTQVALCYIQEHNIRHTELRFDVLSVVTNDSGEWDYRLLKNAFEADGSYL